MFFAYILIRGINICGFLLFQSYPIIYILMTRRTIEAYIAALRYVHEYLISLRGRGFIIDFEKAMRIALHKVDDSLNILGCWFHFCQALRRKVASLKDLFKLQKENIEARNIIRKFQCLALLPSARIIEIFTELCKEALNKSKHFADFVDYFHDEWIKRVKPQYFSVFKQNTRTTASAENFNGRSNKTFKTHGNFYHFCETMQKEELATAEQLELVIGGTIEKTRQSTFYKQRSKLIDEYSEKLINDEISANEFLKVMSNPKNDILYGNDCISTEDIEVEMSINTELFEGSEDLVNESTEIDDLPELLYVDESDNSFNLDIISEDIEGMHSKVS